MQCNKTISVVAAIGFFVFSTSVLAADKKINEQNSKTKVEVEKAEKNSRDVQESSATTEVVLSPAEIEKRGRRKQ